MKNILVIVESFVHRPSPNGICMKRIIDELKKRGNQVTVLTTKTENSQLPEEVIDGVKVYSFRRSVGEELLLRGMTKQGISKWICESLAKFVLRVWLVLACFRWPQRSLMLSKKYIAKARQIMKEEHFDTVVTVYMGIDEVAAGAKIKKCFPKVQFIIYTLDDMSGRRYPKLFGTDVCLKSIKKWEKRVFQYADNICIMRAHINHYRSEEYTQFRSKIRVMDIPLFDANGSPEVNTSKKPLDNVRRIKIAYTGAALVDTGNPTYFIDHVLVHLESCELHLYGRTAPAIQTYLQRHPLYGIRVFVHGMVSVKEVQKIQEQADCLISFGSDNPNMIPCKIFEYFSKYKPVINVYYSENDSAFPYVKKYGFGLQILSTDPDEENVEKLKTFIESLPNAAVPSKEYLVQQFWDNTPYPMVETILGNSDSCYFEA